MTEESLAINGGQPITDQRIPYHRPSLGENEIARAKEAIESRYVVRPGPFCKKVENHLEEEWGVARVLTVTNCTQGMELGLLALDLDEADEVIVPSFTYVSTALAILRAGGTPVFADIDPERLTLTAETIDAVKTDRTRGVLMVHYGGFPGPIDQVTKYCDEHDLFCMEDAAQVYGSSLNGKAAGTWGRFGAISFHGTKSLTCGEGGLFIVTEEEDVSTCEMIRDKGTDRSQTRLGDVDRYTWRTTGSSYVLSDILGAIMWSQINRWPEIKKRRLAVQKHIREGLKKIDVNNRFRLITPPEDIEENGHITAFVMENPEKRDWLIKALQAECIDALEHYHPLHQSPYARENLNPPETLPVSERISESLVRIPAHPELSDEQVGLILEAMEKVYPQLG